METHVDRRLYARVQLCAYGVDTVCIVIQGQERCHLDLVDLSTGGARLKLKELAPKFNDKRLTLSVHGVKDGGRLQNLSAQIRWQSEQEIGVQFDIPLDMTITELQSLIG